MPNNDDCVVALPQIQCPSCRSVLDMQDRHHYQKLSKAQRTEMRKNNQPGGAYYAQSSPASQWEEDRKSEAPEISLIIVTCGNQYCDQYNKFKIFRIPKIETSTTKVGLD